MGKCQSKSELFKNKKHAALMKSETSMLTFADRPTKHNQLKRYERPVTVAVGGFGFVNRDDSVT